MTHQKFSAILSVGDRMLAALRSGEIDAFAELVQKRDELIHDLSDELPADDLQSIVSALTQQHARLDEAMREARTELGSALSAFSRFRSARDAYRPPVHHRRSRLNKSLQG